MTNFAQPVQFFAAVRKSLFGGALTQPQVEGLNELTKAMGAANWSLAFTAYGLATAFHETAGTMQPIRERGMGDRDKDGEDDWFEKYDTGKLAAALGNTPADDNDGGLYCGRGYPQVTGLANYRKATAYLRSLGHDVDLVANPDLMLQAKYAAPVMIDAMTRGWFTGKSLGDYLPRLGKATTAQFTDARRVVNGRDRAADIAAYAVLFQHALIAGAWS